MTRTQLKKRRKAAGLSQQALADRLHVSRIAVNKWEGGSLRMSTRTILAIEAVLAVVEPKEPAPSMNAMIGVNVPPMSKTKAGKPRVDAWLKQWIGQTARLFRATADGLIKDVGSKSGEELLAAFDTATSTGSGYIIWACGKVLSTEEPLVAQAIQKAVFKALEEKHQEAREELERLIAKQQRKGRAV